MASKQIWHGKQRQAIPVIDPSKRFRVYAGAGRLMAYFATEDMAALYVSWSRGVFPNRQLTVIDTEAA